MTEHQGLFLRQARSDFAVFEVLQNQSHLPPCHALHYLQMATEKLAKAHLWAGGTAPKKSHRGFVNFLRGLSTNSQAQQVLRYQGKNWKHTIRKFLPLAQQVEDLAPSLSHELPNPEYPWPEESPQHSPVEYSFPIWTELRKPDGLRFLKFVRDIFKAADVFL